MNAVAELYQVPLDQFVAERKRLAKEAGDPPGFGAVGLHVPPAPKPPTRPHAPPPPRPTKPVIDRAAERKKKERAKLEAQLAKAREHVADLERALRDLDHS